VIITILIPSRQGEGKAERKREMRSADRDYRRGGARPGTRAERQGLLDQRRQLNGVGYGKWTRIDGWSELVIECIRCAGA